MKQIPKSIKILATGGKRALASRMATIRRDLPALSALELVVGDQKVWDYKVLYDGKEIQPQMYAWFDMATAKCVGWMVVPGPYNKYTIAQSLKQVCSYGIPLSGIYTDNGRPEKSKYLASILQDLAAIGAKIENKATLQHVKAKPRWSWSKPIESYWNILEKYMMDETMVGYCKRLSDSDKNEFVQQKLKQDRKQHNLLTFEEFLQKIEKVIDRWNSHEIRRYNQRYVINNFFEQKYKQARKQGLIKVFDSETIDLIFMERTEKKVQGSIVRVNGNEYSNFELIDYDGQYVEVRYDPYDDTQVYILQKDKFITVAEKIKVISANKDKTLQEKIAQKKAYIKEIEKKLTALQGKENKRRVNSISKYNSFARKIKERKKDKFDINDFLLKRYG